MRRTGTSGEGKEQFHAERVVGPQNRAGLQLSVLGCSGTSRPTNQPVGSQLLRHIPTQAVVELSGGEGPSLSYRAPKCIPARKIVRVSRSSCSNTCVISFAKSHRFKHVASLKRRVRYRSGTTWNRCNANCFRSACISSRLRIAEWTRKMRVIRKKSRRFSALTKRYMLKMSTEESILNLDQLGGGPIRSVSN